MEKTAKKLIGEKKKLESIFEMSMVDDKKSMIFEVKLNQWLLI